MGPCKKNVIAWVSTCSLLLEGVETDDQVIFRIMDHKRKTTLLSYSYDSICHPHDNIICLKPVRFAMLKKLMLNLWRNHLLNEDENRLELNVVIRTTIIYIKNVKS